MPSSVEVTRLEVKTARVFALDVLLAANQNFAPVDPKLPRRRLTLQQSIERNRIRFAKTLNLLT